MFGLFWWIGTDQNDFRHHWTYSHRWTHFGELKPLPWRDHQSSKFHSSTGWWYAVAQCRLKKQRLDDRLDDLSITIPKWSQLWINSWDKLMAGWWFGTMEFYDFSILVGNFIYNPNWRTHSIILQRGRLKPPTRWDMIHIGFPVSWFPPNSHVRHQWLDLCRG